MYCKFVPLLNLNFTKLILVADFLFHAATEYFFLFCAAVKSNKNDYPTESQAFCAAPEWAFSDLILCCCRNGLSKKMLLLIYF
jgi:hypothetical protein